MANIINRNGKVITVNSIAHKFTRINENNIEFLKHKPIKIYANSKRFQLFVMQELFKDHPNNLSLVHPGVSFTNITSSYPEFIKKIIKYPMKLIFISPKKASLSVIRGIFADIGTNYWIGPNLCNIWGKPSVKQINSKDNAQLAFNIANNIYKKIEKEKVDYFINFLPTL